MSSKLKPESNGSAIVLEDAETISITGQVFPSAVVGEWRTWAAVLVRLNNILCGVDHNGVTLSSVQICNPREGDGILFVVKGNIKKRAVKGFHRSSNIAQGIASLMDRIAAGSLDWRDDVPFAGRQSVTDESTIALGTPPAV